MIPFQNILIVYILFAGRPLTLLREVFYSKSKMMKSILSIELLYLIENLLLNFRCSALAYRAVYFQVSLGQECQRIE